jgi:tetratricopeptide (TPR) repeat protein
MGCAVHAPWQRSGDRDAPGRPSQSEELRLSWKDRGLALVGKRKYREAIVAFERYMKEHPNDFFGPNAVGICYKNIGNHKEAVRYFDRALELAQKPAQKAKARANLGSLYYSTGNLQTALGYFKEAASEDRANILYPVFIARTFVGLNEHERARNVLAQIERNRRVSEDMTRRSNAARAYYLAARCCPAMGDTDKVVPYLKRALALCPLTYLGRLKNDLENENSPFRSLREQSDMRKLLSEYEREIPFSDWLARM